MNSFKILNSKKVKLLMLVSLVLSLTLGAYLYKGNEIVLEVDGEKENTVTYSKTVGELLEEDDINFKEGAFVSLPLNTKIENNLEVAITNPKIYSFKQEDGLKVVSSIFDNVGDILKGEGVELGTLDYTKPALSETLEEGDVIDIVRVKEETIVEETKIPFEKKEIKSNKFFKGETKVQQKGAEGISAKHIKKRYENGKLVKEEVVKEEITKKKYDNVVLVGTKEKPVAKKVTPVTNTKSASRGSISNSRINRSNQSAPSKGRTITMNASAYTDNVQSQGKWVGMTASGMKARYGVVAVDPSVIPLGTKLYIEGYGNAVAGDTGGAIKGNRIDLFFNSQQECTNFGRRQVKVTILN